MSYINFAHLTDTVYKYYVDNLKDTVTTYCCNATLWLMNMFLVFVNFCDTSYRQCFSYCDKVINTSLDGYVLYYAVYCKEDKSYTTLYDYSSFMTRLYLFIITSLGLPIITKNRLIFTYNDLQDNLNDLIHFKIDCVIEVYALNGALVRHMHTHQCDTSKLELTKTWGVVYATLNHGDDVSLDVTYEFNQYLPGILSANAITVGDIACIIQGIKNVKFVHSNQSIEPNHNEQEIEELTLDLMIDYDFNEYVLKDNDSLHNTIFRNEVQT